MAEATAPTRRARLREQTLGEIKQQALEQLADGGPQAVSLSAIARAIGTTGPALYRYFASRDELITTLVSDGFGELADALEQVAADARRRAPADRLRAVAEGYRGWALAHPHRYRLLFGSTYGSGRDAPETVPASHRSMAVLLDALAAVRPEVPVAAPLERQLAGWAQSREGGVTRDVATLYTGVLGWTRLHGLVSLEIEGVFASMGLDPGLLYTTEVEGLIGSAG